MHFLKKNSSTSIFILLTISMATIQIAWSQPYPPLLVDISAEHPLFIFQQTELSGGSPERYAEAVTAAWSTLPESLRSMSAILVDVGTGHGRHERYEALLLRMQEGNIPAIIRLGTGADRYPLTELEALLRTYTIVRGVEAPGLSFNIYDSPIPEEQWGAPAHIAWLAETIDLAARYGRLTLLPLNELHWTRIMANRNTRALYDRIANATGYVIPIAHYHGDHLIPHISSMMGAWLEDAVDFWGVGPDSRWYKDARFQGTGRFGGEDTGAGMPSELYRAMLLNGAMTGATVYTFYQESDLWNGASSRYWHNAILPTIEEIIDTGLIARKDFVQRRTPVALQLRSAGTPLEFHENLRDLDGLLNQGLLIHAAYGMERPGQIPELIPNNGRYFYVPVLSAHLGNAAVGRFEHVAIAGETNSLSDWRDRLDAFHSLTGEGSAFITTVGRGIFIMNTRENVSERQNFQVNEVPTPVRSFEARRIGDGVELNWPFREGDVSYKVFRRFMPDTQWSLIASGVTQNRFTDAAAGPSDAVAYTITALTNEKEMYEGSVGYGEYLALSVVESRIDHEVVLNAVMNFSESRPILTGMDFEAVEDWWPTYEGAEDGSRRNIAEAIVEQIESWERAVTSINLDTVLNIYDTEYEDPQGWGIQYVQRAYQWLFERYHMPRMHRQLRRWDFSTYEYSGEVNVLMYCSIQAYALSDTTGRIADLPISLPRTDSSEIWVTWVRRDQTWKILRTNPALPNFKELLGYSSGPFDNLVPGPDLFEVVE